MSTLRVIYEGPCTFCNWARRFVEKRAAGHIEFIAYHRPEAVELLREHPELYARREETIIVLKEETDPAIKFRACLVIARHMHRPWPAIAGFLRIVPAFLGDLGYDLIGRMRPLLSKLVAKK